MKASIVPADAVSSDVDVVHRDGARAASVGPAAFLVALGVFVQAEIGYVGRTSGAFPAPVYFLTLCAIYTPAVVIAASRRYSDNAKIWFTLYACVAQLICRFLLYPDLFVYHDEIIHQQVVQSIDATGHLFGSNWLLPVVSYYPGTEITTSAVQRLTGLPFHPAAMFVLILVRVIMILALIRIVERISHNVTLACLAAMIFAGNPQFVFFYSLFSYQSAALPLAFFAVYVFSIRRPALGIAGLAPTIAVVAAVAVTHHLTSLGLVLFFWGWWLVSAISKKPVRQLLPISVISTAIVAAWTSVASAQVVPYVGQIITTDWSSVVALLEGKSAHHFFTDSADYHSAAWEILLSLAAVLITVAALAPALLHGFRQRKLARASGLVLLLIAAAYPIWPLGHIPPATSEAADRSAPFIFVGVSYVCAKWYYDRFVDQGPGRALQVPRPWSASALSVKISPAWSVAAVSIALSIIFVGNTIIGTGPNWSYGPGPYLVEADSRSIDGLALSAAYWESANIPRQSRAFTDRDNALLAETYGHLRVLAADSSDVEQGPLSTLLLSGATAADVSIACGYDVQYLIADRRIATSLPHLGIYIDSGEYLDGTRTAPPPISALTKFDNVPGAERIYDNGAIRIYDLKGMSCAGKR